MKTRHISCLIALLVSAAAPVLAQSPPNDDFANATPLSGSSITFTGTLVGATYEAAETNTSFPYPQLSGGSVWWTWTASQSSTVIIAPQQIFSPDSGFAFFYVYSGSNLVSVVPISGEVTFNPPRGRYGWFSASAGQTYYLRAYGMLPGSFSLQLIATNSPIFIMQPHDTSVSPHGSAFFGALATGAFPAYLRKAKAAYQWTFNGVPIPGQTAPSLLVHDVGTNQVGNYSVIASNAGGVTVSASAALALINTNPVPQLRASKPAAPDSLPFTLNAEPGRWYRLESSTNLQAWVNPSWLQPATPSNSLSVSRLGPVHFVRASLDTPTDVCVAQLKQMLWAQYAFAIENSLSTAASYSLFDLRPYVPLNSLGALYPCPGYGYYSPGPTVIDFPTCQLHARGHEIIDAP